MNTEQLKMKNDQAALRFQCLVQTENLQAVLWLLLWIISICSIALSVKGKIHPKFQMSVFTF